MLRIWAGFFILFALFGCSELTEPCIIENATAVVGECQTDSTYILTLDFTVRNSTNDYFDLFDRENNSIGYFSLAELPLTIESFALSGKDFDYLQICINDNKDCCEEIEFEAPDCSHKKCKVSELKITTGECAEENTYQLTLDFDHANAGNDFFDVFVRENKRIGTYKLADLPVTIENFESSGNEYDFMKICINDNEECCKVAEFKAPDCQPEVCEIGELAIDPGECTGKNTYNLTLNFDHANAGNEHFNVYVRDNKLIGTYKLADLPITIENFESSGNEYDFMKICINDNEECCKVAEFKAPKCESQMCEISKLNLTSGACQTDSTYSLTINFDYKNPGNDLFEVYTRNNSYIGYFRLDELPLTIKDFKKSGLDYDYIKVCINDQENCCKEEEILSPKCE